MKDTRTFALLAALVVVLALGGPCRARADMIVVNLDTVTGGGFKAGDLSSSPYLTAAIADATYQGVPGVFLTLSAPGLGFAGSGKYEHVNNGKTSNPAWLFNLSSTSGLTTSSFTLLSMSGNNGFTTPTITIGSSSTLQAGKSGEYFNLGFGFAEGKGPTDGRYGGVEFGFGDSIKYFIADLSTSSFVPAALQNGQPSNDYSAAAIDDAKGGLWIAGNPVVGPPVGAGGGPVVTPEPSSWQLVLAGGAALLFFLRRLRVLISMGSMGTC